MSSDFIQGKSLKDWILGILLGLCVFFLGNMYTDFRALRDEFISSQLETRQIQTEHQLLKEAIIELKVEMRELRNAIQAK